MNNKETYVNDVIGPGFDSKNTKSFLFLVEVDIKNENINYSVFFDDKAV